MTDPGAMEADGLARHVAVLRGIGDPDRRAVVAVLCAIAEHLAPSSVVGAGASVRETLADLGRALPGTAAVMLPADATVAPGSAELLVLGADAPAEHVDEAVAALAPGGLVLAAEGVPKHPATAALWAARTGWEVREPVGPEATRPVGDEALRRRTELLLDLAGGDAGADLLARLVARDEARVAEVAHLRRATDDARAVAQEASAQLELALGSRSWRITAPLRGLGGRMRTRSPRTEGAGVGQDDHRYQGWVARYDTLDPEETARLRAWGRDVDGPEIAVVLPVYNTPTRFLRLAVESVLHQHYPRWQLCVADDASTAPDVRRVLREYADRDDRVRLVLRERNGHISAASNSALELADAPFVAFLDHDDMLAPHALATVAAALASRPAVRFLYSDEDRVTENGYRYGPYFKPDLNPELLLGQNYITHLMVIHRELVAEVGGFREGFEGSQDHDLALRCLAGLRPEQVHHVPRVLYHWRAIEGSVAMNLDEKPYAVEAGLRAVRERVQRDDPGATVEHGSLGATYRVHFPLPDPAPQVTIVIPTRNGEDVLRRCIDSIRSRTTYAARDILLVDNGSDDPSARRYLAELDGMQDVRVLPYDAPFNYAAINNVAAREARGEFLLLLNNDTEVLTPDWIEQMLMWGVRVGVGTVGSKLFYGNDTIQHAGLIMGIGGIAGHSHRHLPAAAPGYFGRLQLVHRVGGNTGACLLMRRDLYLRAGGLNERHLAVSYNDVDLCLRLTGMGYHHIFTPFATLAHHESVSRGSDENRANRERAARERAYMTWRWGDALLQDPSYNPNLSLQSEAFALAEPPRVPPLADVTDPPRPGAAR
ncbi:MAG: glycosyltransferase family 2 protein [Thermoleophilia bacterium]